MRITCANLYQNRFICFQDIVFTSSVTNVKKNFQPFTAELRTLIHKKHRLWNRWISSRNDIVYKDYKVTRNKVKSEMAKLLREEQEKNFG